MYVTVKLLQYLFQQQQHPATFLPLRTISKSMGECNGKWKILSYLKLEIYRGFTWLIATVENIIIIYNTNERLLYANTLISSMRYVYYLRQDGDSEGLVVVLTHQVEGDDWEDVPRCGASLPTYQPLPQPELRGKLLRLGKKAGKENIHSFISHTSLLQIRVTSIRESCTGTCSSLWRYFERMWVRSDSCRVSSDGT